MENTIEGKINAIMQKHSFNEFIEAFKNKGCTLSLSYLDNRRYSEDEVRDIVYMAFNHVNSLVTISSNAELDRNHIDEWIRKNVSKLKK